MQQVPGEFLEAIIAGIIRHNVKTDANNWLQEKAGLIREEENGSQLNLSFATVPRKTGKLLINLTEDEKNEIRKIHPEFRIDDWTIDRLARVWLLLQVATSDKEIYFRKLENLYKAAEVNELVALYSALIGFAYPEEWQKQCSEGIRSNIGIVLEAIMYNNHYPYKHLNEQAWNQLVLKAFFTDKDVNRIIGLDDRSNKELASILIDYANERWSAHRSVNPQLWRLVSAFINEANFNYIEKAFASNDVTEKKAAALASFQSNYPPAKQLLEKDPFLKSAIIQNEVNWNTL